jgi:manganese transport protein
MDARTPDLTADSLPNALATPRLAATAAGPAQPARGESHVAVPLGGIGGGGCWPLPVPAISSRSAIWTRQLGDRPRGRSKFGYTLLSVILLSNLMAILLQALAARLGIVTDRDLAQACRASYSRRSTSCCGWPARRRSSPAISPR